MSSIAEAGYFKVKYVSNKQDLDSGKVYQLENNGSFKEDATLVISQNGVDVNSKTEKYYCSYGYRSIMANIKACDSSNVGLDSGLEYTFTLTLTDFLTNTGINSSDLSKCVSNGIILTISDGSNPDVSLTLSLVTTSSNNLVYRATFTPVKTIGHSVRLSRVNGSLSNSVYLFTIHFG